MKAVFCCPTLKRPYQQFLDAMRASVPVLDKAKIKHRMVWEIGCPYISHARSKLLRKALDAKADVIVFLDHDLSFPPDALLKLIRTEGDVVSGLYRFKLPEVEYMGQIEVDDERYPVVRKSDGAIKATRIPAGFLKLTRNAVIAFMRAYPELVYGDPIAPHVDLFNHGAHDGVWWGEDYAFSRRWREKCGDIWVVPDLDLTHHDHDAGDFPGNLHRFLLADKPKAEAA